MTDSRRITATLEGYTLWAFERYREVTGKSPAKALDAFIDRLLERDPEFARTYGLTLDDYHRATPGDVVRMAETARRSR